jgi:DNA processing protein
LTTSTLTTPERIDWLRLARSESVGPVTFAHLIGRYGSARQALEALPELARRGGRAKPLSIPSRPQAEAELAAGEALGATFIAGCEAGFPRMLAVLDPPPPLLWALGNPDLLARRMVAVVGARVASAAGRRFAHTLAADLGAAGYVVVSGMARGIDAAAHEGSLPSGTVAVLGGGVDNVYPAENAGLYEAIVSSGCIVSERAIGHVARAADFPRRNRIIAGLSLGVVVVEAELRSGSLITARLAGEQGREVFAVPGSPLDPRSRGANDLIRQGAALVEDAQDVVRVLDAQPGLYAPPPADFARGEHPSDAETDEIRELLLGLLSPTPTSLDDLARASGAPVPLILAAMMELTLSGRAELLGGGLAVSIPDA